MSLLVTYRIQDITDLYDGELPAFIDKVFFAFAANEALVYHHCSAQRDITAFPRDIVCLINDLYNSDDHGDWLSEFESGGSQDSEIAIFSESDWQSFPIAEIQEFDGFEDDYEDLNDQDIDNADWYQPYGWNLREILGLDGPVKYETPEKPSWAREDHHAAPEPMEQPVDDSVAFTEYMKAYMIPVLSRGRIIYTGEVPKDAPHFTSHEFIKPASSPDDELSVKCSFCGGACSRSTSVKGPAVRICMNCLATITSDEKLAASIEAHRVAQSYTRKS